jgi:chloramphenicol O-acetyltransferase type A
MPTELDPKKWKRREIFEYFLDFDKPYFNLATELDVTALFGLLKQRPEVSKTLAYHYFALRAANEIEPFHYRLREGKVIVHEVVNAGSTVLMPNETFTFAYFDYHEEFDKFIHAAQAAVNEVLAGDGSFRQNFDQNRIHFTTIPWVSFTSFSHARNWRTEDSIPKMAFGKFFKDGERTLLPFSVEVHHALMDGLHVGRLINWIEEALTQPENYINSKKP